MSLFTKAHAKGAHDKNRKVFLSSLPENTSYY